MMDLRTIIEMNNQRAAEAMSAGEEPYFVDEAKLREMRENFSGFPFPNIGSYEPPGWEEVEDYFVDSSGFGAEGEPALTAGQFLDKIEPGFGYAVTSVGQFQVYVTKFKRA